MAINNDAVDAVVVGLGWAGSIVSIELAKAGLKVRALESGPERTNADYAYPKPADQLGYSIRQKLFERAAKSTVTVRYDASQEALPMRRWGAFKPGAGVGGAGVHWTGVLMRPRPTDLKLKTFIDETYKPGQLQADMQVQDFPFTWEEMEPHLDFFERVCGASGAAGNLRGVIQEAGNPFEGPRANPYPLPPLQDCLSNTMFAAAAKKLGYHPFTNPSAAASGPWTNPYGQQIAPCNYCGFCSDYFCLNYSKASPQTTILDAVKRMANFSYRTNAHVIRVDLHDDKKTAKGVTYIDEQGREVFQPAAIVVLAGFQYNNVRLMLLSGIGQPYDPRAGTGVVGRNYAFLSNGHATLFYKDKRFNSFAAAGPTGQIFNDFSPGNFDATPYGFVGGAKVESDQMTGAPIGTALPAGTPAWGSAWKKGLKDWYDRSMKVSITTTCMSYRGNYLDLDPTYRDPFGQPLLRMTFDWQPNELKLQQFLRTKVLEIVRELAPDSYTESFLKPGDHWDTRAYVSTHNVGGAVAGADPRTSAVNRYLQSWDMHNVFVAGGSAFPQNFQSNPTCTIGAMTYFALERIVGGYLKSPGPLVQV